MKTGFVSAPSVPWEGRRMACVLVSNEAMAAVLLGQFAENHLSNAPADLSVVAATTHDAHTLAIYVESETFAPLDERGRVPIYTVMLSKAESNQ